MGKTGRWFKSFLGGKKDKGDKDLKNNVSNNNTSVSIDHRNASTPVVVVQRSATPKEKKRWSFRRSSASNNNNSSSSNTNNNNNNNNNSNDNTAYAKDANVADASTNAVALQKTSEGPRIEPVGSAVTEERDPPEVVDIAPSNAIVAVTEEAAAVKIQAAYRSYLARKALKALRGLVKLQALVRGHLVRKQATATLRCMQALVTAQARARAQRVRSEDEVKMMNHRQSTHRRHNLDRITHSYHEMEENIKIVEMDRGEFISNVDSMSSYSIPSQHQFDERMDNRMSLSTYYSPQGPYIKQDYQQYSPAPSGITDISPRTCSGHFEDYSFATAQSSPQCYSAMSRPDQSRAPFSFPQPDFADTMSYDFPLYPNYMANTKSSRAKARSQSAPKQRPELERQPSRGRRPSVEGRNIPKGAKMQRSSSHVGSAAQNFQYPWSVKLDKSIVSLRESECGSTCSVTTNTYYSRSVVSHDPRC